MWLYVFHVTSVFVWYENHVYAHKNPHIKVKQLSNCIYREYPMFSLLAAYIAC